MPKSSFTLHCDACHEDLAFAGTVGREHVGFACPSCGEDMLTEKDFKVAARVMRLLKVLEFFGLAKVSEPGSPRPTGSKINIKVLDGQVSTRQVAPDGR